MLASYIRASIESVLEYPVTALYTTRVLVVGVHPGIKTLITAKVAMEVSDRANGAIINILDKASDILVTSRRVTIQILLGTTLERFS